MNKPDPLYSPGIFFKEDRENELEIPVKLDVVSLLVSIQSINSQPKLLKALWSYFEDLKSERQFTLIRVLNELASLYKNAGLETWTLSIVIGKFFGSDIEADARKIMTEKSILSEA